MTSLAEPASEPAIASRRHRSMTTLLALSDAIAAMLLAADLLAVCVFGGSALLVQCAGRMVRRRRARADGRLKLLWSGERAGACRKSGRRVLHRPAASEDAGPRRCCRRSAGRPDRGPCGLQCPQAWRADSGPDHGLRIAAGAHLLSDGHRRAVHDRVRARPVSRASFSRRDRRRHGHGAHRRPLPRLGITCACIAAVIGHADADRLLHHTVRRPVDRLRAGLGCPDLYLGRGHGARRHLRPANGARHRQFRAARDPLFHPGRLSHGSGRHVDAADRAVAPRGRRHARRAQCRDGDLDGVVLLASPAPRRPMSPQSARS
jgi:hypothetical protein